MIRGSFGAVGAFPRTRMRRNRRAPWVRRMVAETRLDASDLIWPAFVIEGRGRREPVASMPGVERLSTDLLVEAAAEAAGLGIPAIAVFPYVDPSLKTPDAGEAVRPDNLVCRAVRALKEALPDLGVLCDVALDPYNSDGHDGIVRGGAVLNDETVEVLCRQALVQAEAGCDIIAPSDMMDGRIGAIRDALDGAGFGDVLIMSYCGQVRLGLLRAVSRRGRLQNGPQVRQADLPDGPGEHGRGAARSRPRSGRRRRHGDR